MPPTQSLPRKNETTIVRSSGSLPASSAVSRKLECRVAFAPQAELGVPCAADGETRRADFGDEFDLVATGGESEHHPPGRCRLAAGQFEADDEVGAGAHFEALAEVELRIAGDGVGMLGWPAAPERHFARRMATRRAAAKARPPRQCRLPHAVEVRVDVRDRPRFGDERRVPDAVGRSVA